MRGRALTALVLLAPATGWAQPAGFAGHDDSAPIEITADELEVRQSEGVATFKGDVDAVQGELTLSAQTLDVFYGDSGGDGDRAEDADDGVNGDQAMGEIRRVEAHGDVVVSSPREIARGSE
ncbi:MAG: LptA/OstA family protein, partial [Alphaproteobacteria bacterium]